jgi:hypothetical protein
VFILGDLDILSQMVMNELKRARTWPLTVEQTNETNLNAPLVMSVAPVHENIEPEEGSSSKTPDELTKPTTLPAHKTVFENMTSWITDILLISVPILFIVLGVVVKQLDGKLVESNPYGNAVLEATQYVLTFSSILMIGRYSLLFHFQYHRCSHDRKNRKFPCRTWSQTHPARATYGEWCSH